MPLGWDVKAVPLTSTLSSFLETILTAPLNILVPISSIKGMLFTSPRLPQLIGGTKNISWLASLPPPVPWYINTSLLVEIYMLLSLLNKSPSIKWYSPALIVWVEFEEP